VRFPSPEMHEQQAPSNKLDKKSQIMYDEDIMRIRKKLVKEIKKTNPDLAEEIKYMTKKEFRALMEVFNVWCRL
jgi:uncharacterized protein YaaN involved in tellurite resistance